MPVGAFRREPIENIISLVQNDTINDIQLHDQENERYIQKLKALTNKPIIKAVTAQDEELTVADYLMFDNIEVVRSRVFNWGLIGNISKPFFGWWSLHR